MSAAAIAAALSAARPQAVGALLRYFRDLDTAEEAFQEASLRALRSWPDKGLPRDPTAWLIFVGRNAALDEARKRAKTQALPDEELLSDLGDAESAIAEDIDAARYPDDLLRLLFICCHPELPPNQQDSTFLFAACMMGTTAAAIRSLATIAVGACRNSSASACGSRSSASTAPV